MSYKIIIDSCGELLERWKTDERIERAPLTLTVDGEDIVDDETFDQAYFLKKFYLFGNLGQHTLGIYIVQTIVFQFYGRKELGLNEYLYDWIFVPIISVCILLISYITVLLLSKYKITRHYLLGNWK